MLLWLRKVLRPDEITQLIEAGHLPPQAAVGGSYGAGTASPAAPPAQIAPTRTVTPLSGADLLERRVAAPTPPPLTLVLPLAPASAPQSDPFRPVPSPSISGTPHCVDALKASLTLCTDAYVPTAVASPSLEDALRRARERVVEGAWPNEDLFHFMDQALPAQLTPWTEVIVVVGHSFHFSTKLPSRVGFLWGIPAPMARLHPWFFLCQCVLCMKGSILVLRRSCHRSWNVPDASYPAHGRSLADNIYLAVLGDARCR